MRPTGNHIHAAVLRAVAAIAGNAVQDRQKPAIIIEAIAMRDWASVTFTGATHALELRLEGTAACVADAGAALVAALPDHDIPVAGQIVADIAVTLGAALPRDASIFTQSLTVNLLTILD